MLTQQILDILEDNRRSDLVFQHLVGYNVPQPYSQSLKQEMKLIGDCACILLQECDQLPIRKATKYLAKNYFDRFMAHCFRQNLKIQTNKKLLVAFTAISIAIKFNQNSQISDAYNSNYYYQKSGEKFTISEFIVCEIQLLSILGYKLKITTPYDFLEPIKQMFPKNIKKMAYLEGLIDLSLTLDELVNLSAQQRFFGCFLLCLESCWNGYIQSVICALTSKFLQAKRIALIIKQAYAQILGFSQ